MARAARGTSSDTAFSLSLSWRELSGRRLVFAFNVVIIAFLVALPVTLDLMGRARRASVDTRMDYMGPSLSLVPPGTSSYDLATGRMQGQTITEGTVTSVRNDFPEWLKAAEPRLITRMAAEGRLLPVMGVDFSNVYSYPLSQYRPPKRSVLAGQVAAEKLGVEPGDTVRIQSRAFSVAGVIPTTGTIEDASLFMALQTLQELTGLTAQINEVRLFPRSPAALDALKASLATYYSHLEVVDSYRGDVVEKDIGTTLTNYQKAVYAAAFVLIALCIMISTWINLESRKAEISTIYTLGARQGIVFRVLAFRIVWLALLGAVVGHALGILAVLSQDVHAPILHLWSWRTFIIVAAGTVMLGLVVTIPFMFHSVYRRNLLADL